MYKQITRNDRKPCDFTAQNVNKSKGTRQFSQHEARKTLHIETYTQWLAVSQSLISLSHSLSQSLWGSHTKSPSFSSFAHAYRALIIRKTKQKQTKQQNVNEKKPNKKGKKVSVRLQICIQKFDSRCGHYVEHCTVRFEKRYETEVRKLSELGRTLWTYLLIGYSGKTSQKSHSMIPFHTLSLFKNFKTFKLLKD